MGTKTEQVTPVKVLVDSRVVVEPGWTPINYFRKTEEDKAKWLEQWAKDLMEFFRDHRHQDVNSVFVEPVYETRCSQCDGTWEVMTFEADESEPAYVGCASCGAPLKTE
jgi:hypothetical protein